MILSRDTWFVSPELSGSKDPVPQMCFVVWGFGDGQRLFGALMDIHAHVHAVGPITYDKGTPMDSCDERTQFSTLANNVLPFLRNLTPVAHCLIRQANPSVVLRLTKGTQEDLFSFAEDKKSFTPVVPYLWQDEQGAFRFEFTGLLSGVGITRDSIMYQAKSFCFGLEDEDVRFNVKIAQDIWNKVVMGA